MPSNGSHTAPNGAVSKETTHHNSSIRPFDGMAHPYLYMAANASAE